MNVVSGGFVLKFVTIPLVHSRVAVFKGTHLTMTKSLAQVNSENLYTASSHDRIILRYMNKLSFFITAILNTFYWSHPPVYNETHLSEFSKSDYMYLLFERDVNTVLT